MTRARSKNGRARLAYGLFVLALLGIYDYAIGRGHGDCGCAYVDKHDREIGQFSVD